ncbi:hypothetical protein [Streptomyces kebangsaanensis]|uniref:hypothetical protein n=1 Tax=Streptomyces kebangsaanensis TaxID=864058 RepID=UPI000A53F655|nr:hypothetical protein [Streptomyces kebangsaanensis]
MSLRDFLARFRPTGTPGAAVAGVPADRAAERAAELEPPLARLADVQREAARIRAEADREAEALRQDAAREAAAIVTAARAQVPRVRQEAAVPVRRAARLEGRDIRSAGDRAAARVYERARERMPALLDRVVADALWVTDRPEGAP